MTRRLFRAASPANRPESEPPFHGRYNPPFPFLEPRLSTLSPKNDGRFKNPLGTAAAACYSKPHGINPVSESVTQENARRPAGGGPPLFITDESTIFA